MSVWQSAVNIFFLWQTKFLFILLKNQKWGIYGNFEFCFFIEFCFETFTFIDFFFLFNANDCCLGFKILYAVSVFLICLEEIFKYDWAKKIRHKSRMFCAVMLSFLEEMHFMFAWHGLYFSWISRSTPSGKKMEILLTGSIRSHSSLADLLGRGLLCVSTS